jgi:hypothetical protein
MWGGDPVDRDRTLSARVGVGPIRASLRAAETLADLFELRDRRNSRDERLIARRIALRPEADKPNKQTEANKVKYVENMLKLIL